MKVLVMNCSPVRNGATAEIVNIVTARLEKQHDVKNICIDDYDIKFCKGCRTCHNTAKCVQNDDVDRIIEQYEWADIVISVSPSYWADIPGQFKVFIDRCTPWCNTHEPHAKTAPASPPNTLTRDWSTDCMVAALFFAAAAPLERSSVIPVKLCWAQLIFPAKLCANSSLQ